MSLRLPSPLSRPRSQIALVVLLACAVATIGAWSCRSRPPLRVRPVSEAASEALAQARAALRGGDDAQARATAIEWAERARDHAPEWVAPRRFLDDALREDLRGTEALRAHYDALAHEFPIEDARARAALAAELYLAGRLEGRDGEERFEAAARLAPELAWAHHGVAFAAAARGDRRSAVAAAQRALERARDPWERSFFSSSLARFYVQAQRRQDALRTLARRLGDPDLSAADRSWLAVEAVEIGLTDPELARRTTSYAAGLELARSADLSETHVATLTAHMRRTGSLDDPDGRALALALATHASPARDRLRAELMLEVGSAPLALGLLRRSLASEGRALPAGPLMRSARFAAQQFHEAVEVWCADLPARFRDPDGVPFDARLARVVERARALPPAHATSLAAGDALAALGDALIDAGWFPEARSVAVALAASDLDRALALESRGLAGQELFDGVRRLVQTVDLDLGPSTPWFTDTIDVDRILASGDRVTREGPIADGGRIGNLTGLIHAMAPLFARANAFLGGETDPRAVAEQFLAAPRSQYGPLAELVHPGPWFSMTDQRQGLGERGVAVPGLAFEMARLGRFALFGEVSGGGGPDGAILQRVMIEERAGEHLGQHWSGLVVWCEGADLLSRAGRRGAHISAAALHEGYWVDIAAVRAEHAAWERLRREFSGPDAAQRVERVLAERGFPLAPGAATRRERTRTGALLGEGERTRLAILFDRRDRHDATSVLGEMPLDELLGVTATHEEGHLCDRARFLPITKHLPRVLAFLLDCGFSPRRVTEALEYRAQLVALCDVADPRVALVQILESAEAGPSGLTPHADGYARLLDDFLDVLADRVEKDAQALPAIDPRYTLAHQLHRLPPEAVRSLARALASRKRLDR